MTKVPKILSKSSAVAGHSGENVAHGNEESIEGRTDITRPADKMSTVVLKGRNVDGVRSNSNHITASIPGLLAGDTLMQPQLQQLHSAVQPPSSSAGSSSSSAGYSASAAASHSVKMIDDALVWSDAALEMMLEQQDFLVIGVLGMQGVGKSTVMSALAGNDRSKTRVFDTVGTKVFDSVHQTNGIDVYVTHERTILLDSQPLMSASVLDNLIHQDKKTLAPATTSPLDHAGLDNSAELQSLQIASFMMTVCNVVVVVIDWFIDVSLIRFLQLAEMMKPSTPGTGGHTGPNGYVSGTDETSDYYPHIAFVLNHAEMSHYRPECKLYMQQSLSQLMNQSKLKFTGLIPAVAAHTSRATRATKDMVNLFLLPNITDGSGRLSGSSGVDEVLAGYTGYRDFIKHMKDFTHCLLAMPRQPLTQHNLSEKTWFHYAARCWDVVRKSQLLAEYSRLQS